jgi:hypothetical protein
MSPLGLDVILGILNPVYLDPRLTGELRFLAHLVAGGDETAEILVAWLGRPVTRPPRPTTPAEGSRTLKAFQDAWIASLPYPDLRHDLEEQIGRVAAGGTWSKKELPLLRWLAARLEEAGSPNAAAVQATVVETTTTRWWTTVAFAAGAVVGVNLLLLLLATRITLVRTMMLDPVGSKVWGLVIGKYLLTDWLIRFVHPLKLAMFRDYRLQLRESAALKTWKTRPYISPEIGLRRAPPEEAATSLGEPWERTLDHLLRLPRRCLWLIQGPSGLGKTALLEQWTGLALKREQTPFLIRLGSDLRPEEEAAALMAQYGDVNAKSTVAQDLLIGGGFLIFLDGYNEDPTPDATREFVRQVTKRNLVVLSSQFDPRWDKIVDVHRIELAPFGRQQLSDLLADEWVTKVLLASHLETIVRLPATALLLARFIKRKNELPQYGLEVYEDLRDVLNREYGSRVLTLEETAWKLFRANETEFHADGLPEEFCNDAVEAAILARRRDRYVFVHERIQRFFVACYLHRQERKPLEFWYRQGEPGIARAYWADVLEFLAEMDGRLVCEGKHPRESYQEFLKEGARFDGAIFAERLYPQYRRLCASGSIKRDEEFVNWAADFLVGFVAEPRMD